MSNESYSLDKATTSPRTGEKRRILFRSLVPWCDVSDDTWDVPQEVVVVERIDMHANGVMIYARIGAADDWTANYGTRDAVKLLLDRAAALEAERDELRARLARLTATDDAEVTGKEAYDACLESRNRDGAEVPTIYEMGAEIARLRRELARERTARERQAESLAEMVEIVDRRVDPSPGEDDYAALCLARDAARDPYLDDTPYTPAPQEGATE